eukprot:TRINITY_DN1447_c0_g2_i1.p1 TRINITY_DN1447_c0_g2~~TRINITY_DN1447_c0_g2_i1.p1  ORF type:complete len:224 (-),score=40.49 TRINITY_DN1447_c0_g2_i1:240-911(-)
MSDNEREYEEDEREGEDVNNNASLVLKDEGGDNGNINNENEEEDNDVFLEAIRSLENGVVDVKTYKNRSRRWPQKSFLKTKSSAPRKTEFTEVEELKTGRMVVKDVCKKHFQHLKKVLPKHVLDQTASIIDETLESLIVESMEIKQELGHQSKEHEFKPLVKDQNYIFDAAARLGIPSEVIERTRETYQSVRRSKTRIGTEPKEEEGEEPDKPNEPKKKRKKT